MELKIVPKLNAIMLDFESASLRSDAAILSGAMIAFDMYNKESPDIIMHDFQEEYTWVRGIRMMDMFALGMRFDQDTGLWWGQQEEAVRESLDINTGTPSGFVKSLDEFIRKVKKDSGLEHVPIFARHTHRDWCWLENLCIQLGVKTPIGYNKIFDISTVLLVATGKMHGHGYTTPPIQLPRHSALGDVYQDAYQLACHLHKETGTINEIAAC